MAKNNIAARWLVGTLGLILIAFGVALSLKSNLGTAPPSCPPAVLNLKWDAISFGTFTWIMHLFFIGAQMAMRRKVLDVHYLLQLAAAFVFGYLCDACIWLLHGVEISSYLMKVVLILIAVILTAIGIRLEVIGKAWILAGDGHPPGGPFRRLRLDMLRFPLRPWRGDRHPRRNAHPGRTHRPVHETHGPAGGQGIQTPAA